MTSDNDDLEAALQENLKLRRELAADVAKAEAASSALAGRWRRGFFRLWIALSVLWVAVVGWIALSDKSIPSLTKSCSVLLEFKNKTTGEFLKQADVQECEAIWRDERRRYLVGAFGPPLALFVIGLTIVWIAAGFRRP